MIEIGGIMDNFSVVFSKDTGNAENYRIPSVVVT